MGRRKLADPRRYTPGQTHLNEDLCTFLKKCREQDPPPRPQQAVPNHVFHWIGLNFLPAPVAKLQALANLTILAFFFLLRVGEYTHSSQDRLTVPLRKQDVRLWRNTSEIPHSADFQTLMSADSITICLENQKNGHKNAILHHTSSNHPILNPVTAGAHIIYSLRDFPASTPLSTYTNERGQRCQVRSSDIVDTIRLASQACGLESYGYDLDRIGSHSIRAAGATHLKISGYDHDMIQKMGRWRGETYLRYIQTQIGELTAGVATAMSKLRWFHNVS